MEAKQVQTEDAETLHELVDELEAGDTFQIHAWECKVDEVVDMDARPYLTIQKKSVSGYMAQSYRLEWDNLTNDNDETLVIKADRKHGWDAKFRFQPSELDY